MSKSFFGQLKGMLSWTGSPPVLLCGVGGVVAGAYFESEA